MSAKVLVIIPALNEAASIAGTVREVLACGYPVMPLVVDDGSSDGTAKVALEAGARVVSLPFNLGIGGAVQAGYRYALAHGFDIAIQVDGDGQHDASYIPLLVQTLVDGRVDMVVGSRFLKGQSGFRSTLLRRVGIRFFTWLIGSSTGLAASDPTSGFRACGRRLIRIFAGYYPQDFPEPESLVVAKRLGARILDVPVIMRGRTAGKSSIGKLKSPYYMVKVTLAILLHLFKTRKAYGLWE
jgi:glycosyltransferase involved in cell wall biosynthesis